ncbi:MAG: NUDIX domain-containing protein [Clostridia bacterium]|nr:NUDIX domain-containing protein [Clostridia bacterium]
MMETITQYAKTYSDPPEKERISSRGIIVENGKILLSHEVNTGVYMSPGGGLEDGETLEECCIRELKEETGFDVKPTKHFVIINEYCFETLYISNYFLCEITGKSKQSLTDIEVEHGITPEWVELEKALEIFGDYASKREDVGSLYLREFTVLNKYLKMK